VDSSGSQREDARAPHPETPDEALAVLLEGNERHRTGELLLRNHSPLQDLASGQKPFAALVTCSDSRVEPTLIFDIDRGNLFSAKVAGNSMEPGVVGSTEFATGVLGVKLVLVMGHSDCGAVKAAMEVAEGTASYPEEEFGAIGELVGRVVPAIESVPEGERTPERCTIANARAQAEELAATGPIIPAAIEAGKLKVLAAIYDIGSRRVELL
jgi:carbonic anhydrase